jgi:hypothetical protein
MSNCRWLLELGSSHCRGQYTLFIFALSDEAFLQKNAMTLFFFDSLPFEQLQSFNNNTTSSPLVTLFMYEWYENVTSSDRAILTIKISNKQNVSS